MWRGSTEGVEAVSSAKGDRPLYPPEVKIGRLADCGVGAEKPVPLLLSYVIDSIGPLGR